MTSTCAPKRRPNTNTYTDANNDADPDANANTNTNINSNTNTDADSNACARMDVTWGEHPRVTNLLFKRPQEARSW